MNIEPTDPSALARPRFSMMEYPAVDVDFRAELEAFASAGADAVGISLFRPPRSRRLDVAEMAATLEELQMPVTYVWPATPSILPIPGFSGATQWRERLRALTASVEAISSLGAAGIGCVTGPSGDHDDAEAERIVVQGLRELARVAGGYGLTVGIEPTSPEERDVFSFLTTLSAAANVIDKVEQPNVGIIADIWHLHDQPRIHEELVRYANHIVLVHVCDRRESTRSPCDRVLPGDGVADVSGFLGALKDAEYGGFFELEVLSDDGLYGNAFEDSLWRLEPAELVALGRDKFLASYDSAQPIRRRGGAASRLAVGPQRGADPAPTQRELGTRFPNSMPDVGVVAGSYPRFPVSEAWAARARLVDAWAATREEIREVDAANAAYPQYFDRADGAYVWDVDRNRYIDFILGYGPVVLGHAHPEVDAAVVRQLQRGTCVSPLWSARQVELAELLTSVVPGAEQAYLMRTGSDATAGAVRLARIYTGREKVVRWGYNGWHDWCAPRPEGVPTSTLEATLHFAYNDIQSLRGVLEANAGEVACVIMMSYEYELPTQDFLNRACDIAHEHGALFILDEMRSGFRAALGGAQELFHVRPDLSTFSKAMANGYAISAIVGRADVLANIGRTHMASTFYANAAEMAAALTTITLLRDTSAIRHIWELSERFTRGLANAVDQCNAPARVVGPPISPFLVFDTGARPADVKVRFYRETLRRGVLLHPNHQWFVSAAHTVADIDTALEACQAAFEVALD
jgi:glutamate-1-semialdehyde aminotransferase/sugar phosphate isomerase/epimerase